MAVTSAGITLYGAVLWDPLRCVPAPFYDDTGLFICVWGRLIDRWDNRAAAFFASFSFVLATLGTNVRLPALSSQ